MVGGSNLYEGDDLNLGIQGKTALVVGASRGIGEAIANELREEGCKVYTVARTGKVDFLMDLMPEGATDLLIAAMSLNPPDIIVHVVGGSMGLTSHLLPAADWAQVWRLNLGIAIDLNRAYLRHMADRKWGRIIHLSSNATRIGSGYGPYTSAKAAVEGYVRQVGREIAEDGVVMTAVAPGIVPTPGRYFDKMSGDDRDAYFNHYIPMGRFGVPQDVAKVVAFLASEHSAYMAGSIVQVDAGAR